MVTNEATIENEYSSHIRGIYRGITRVVNLFPPCGVERWIKLLREKKNLSEDGSRQLSCLK